MCRIESIKKAQQEHFDSVSGDYARKIGRESYDYYLRFTRNAIIGALNEHFSDLSNISGLDLGCGNGDFTAIIGDKCQSMVGADLSSGMIAAANSAHHLANIQFMVSPSDHLEFPDSTFDFSLSVHLLHHLADVMLVRRTLVEMERVTKKNGVIIIVDVNKLNPLSSLIQYLMVSRGVDTGLEKLVAPRLVKNIFKKSGVKRVSYKGFCFVPHFVPWLSKFDEMFGKILPHKIIGKDYLIVGKIGPKPATP